MKKMALAFGLLLAACSDSPPEVTVEVETSRPTTAPGVSVRTRRTVVPEPASLPEATDVSKAPAAGSTDPAASTSPKAASAPRP